MKRVMPILVVVLLLTGCSLVGGRFAGSFSGFGVEVSVDTEVGQIDIDSRVEEPVEEPEEDN